MRILSIGERALLVELDDLDSVLALAAELRAKPPPGVLECVPAARTVLLHCDIDHTTLRTVADAVRRIRSASRPEPPSEVVEIPACYDGPDIGDVLARTGMSRDEFIGWHTASQWQVAFCGFAPGFGYLVTPHALSIPRRPTARTSVPAGSIGVAGEFSGVYPRASPGGWQLIGRTTATLFDLAADPPAQLRPGVGVRFVDCT